MKSLGLLAILAIFSASLASNSYEGYQVWEVTVWSQEHVNLLLQLEREGQIEIAKYVSVGVPSAIIINPAKLQTMRTVFTMSGIHAEIQIENIQEGVDQEMERIRKRYAEDPYSFNMNDFNTYDAFMQQLNTWQSSCPSGLVCSIQTIGTTAEGRALKVFKIQKAGTRNKVLWFESCIHAREWLACATMQNVVNNIIKNYGVDSTVTSKVNKYDFNFLLLANPDGYVYTFGSNRLWRKNRAANPGSVCRGTDLNRNFDDMWGKEGVSDYACDDTYGGSYAASEKETQSIQNTLKSIHNDKGVAAAFIVHCFGRMWMFPYSHTENHQGFQCVRTVDHLDFEQVVEKGKNALEAKEGNYGWRTGTVCETIYPVTGGGSDYAYSQVGIKYAFAMELRGNWFVVDRSQIAPSFREFWAGVVATVDEIAKIEGW